MKRRIQDSCNAIEKNEKKEEWEFTVGSASV